MALKGGRSIVVRDMHFQWKPAHPWPTRYAGVSPRFIDIVVQGKDQSGRMMARLESKLWGVGIPDADIDAEYQYSRGFATHKASVTPNDARLCIEKALDDGWDPASCGQHNLVGPLDLGDYRLR